jgi:hypothetical protein
MIILKNLKYSFKKKSKYFYKSIFCLFSYVIMSFMSFLGLIYYPPTAGWIQGIYLLSFRIMVFSCFIGGIYITLYYLNNRGRLLYHNIEIYGKELKKLKDSVANVDPYGEETWEDALPIYEKYVE